MKTALYERYPARKRKRDLHHGESRFSSKIVHFCVHRSLRNTHFLYVKACHNPTPASRKAPFILLNEGERFFVFQGFARFGRNGAQRASYTSVYTESYTFGYTLSYTFQTRESASHADCESAARTALHPIALHRRVRDFLSERSAPCSRGFERTMVKYM